MSAGKCIVQVSINHIVQSSHQIHTVVAGVRHDQTSVICARESIVKSEIIVALDQCVNANGNVIALVASEAIEYTYQWINWVCVTHKFVCRWYKLIFCPTAHIKHFIQVIYML
jgi:hypothetical protein